MIKNERVYRGKDKRTRGGCISFKVANKCGKQIAEVGSKCRRRNGRDVLKGELLAQQKLVEYKRNLSRKKLMKQTKKGSKEIRKYNERKV